MIWFVFAGFALFTAHSVLMCWANLNDNYALDRWVFWAGASGLLTLVLLGAAICRSL